MTDEGGPRREALEPPQAEVPSVRPERPSDVFRGEARDEATRYTLEESLGRGAAGEVFVARDATFGRRVALKHLRSESPEDKARFLREARIQARLEHPAFVSVHDLGELEARPYFTMQRLRGVTLRAALDQLSAMGDGPSRAGFFSQRRLLNAFIRLCLAVHYAHREGVVHRDLKPANVMLGDFGEVFVLDLGLARLAEEGEAVRASQRDIAGRITPVEDFVGTPGYIAPELITEGAASASAASDIYALGAILFEILALERLNDQEGAPAKLAATIAGMRTSPREREPSCPETLDRICRRALATRPEERFKTARELSDALEVHLDEAREARLRHEAVDAHLRAARMAALGEDDEAEALRAASPHLLAALTEGGGEAKATRALEEAVDRAARASIDRISPGDRKKSRQWVIGVGLRK